MKYRILGTTDALKMLWQPYSKSALKARLARAGILNLQHPVTCSSGLAGRARFRSSGMQPERLNLLCWLYFQQPGTTPVNLKYVQAWFDYCVC